MNAMLIFKKITILFSAFNSNGIGVRNIMGGTNEDKEFATRAVHVGTKHYDGSVNTPIFQSSTYKLTEETYAGWAAGAQPVS